MEGFLTCQTQNLSLDGFSGLFNQTLQLIILDLGKLFGILALVITNYVNN